MQGLRTGPFLARGGERGIGRLGRLVCLGQNRFGDGAGVGGLLARNIGRADGVEQRAALDGDRFGKGFGDGEFAR